MSDTKLQEVLADLDPTTRSIMLKRETDWNDTEYEAVHPIFRHSLEETLNSYSGDNTFLLNVRAHAGLTLRQGRAVANIFRRELRGEPAKRGGHKQSARVHECYTCHATFPSMTEVMEHKRIAHGNGHPAPVASPFGAPSGPPVQLPPPSGLVEIKVLDDGKFRPKHCVSLREFGPGRFAVEDATGKVRFVIVTQLKRKQVLRGRYAWTKFRYAYETLYAGDITVREQSGETKKFIGKQTTTDAFYLGEEEDLIKLVTDDPMAALLRYGKELNRCGYCGRSLTDEESRLRGIGPDCWNDKYIPYVKTLGK